MTDFLLPDIGEGLEEAEIIEWLVSAGDVVERDQPLVEILTDKSQAQIPSPRTGTITRLGGVEGDRLPVGAVLVEFDGRAPDSPTAPSTPHTAPTPDAPSAPASAPTPIRPTPGRVKAAPSVRKAARERGVDLGAITGTGPGGRILAADLDTTAAPAPASPSSAPRLDPAAPARGVGRQPLRGIRRVTAENMAKAWAEVPHIHGHDEVDASALLDARRRLRDRIEGLTMLPLLCMAVATTLRRHRTLNSSIDVEAGHFDIHADIHLGVAVAAPHGLIVPVVTNADRRSLENLTAELSRLIEAARTGTIAVDDLRGATATVTNYGAHGGRFAAPIIRPPEACIVGFGSIAERPIAVDGAVVARPTIPVSIGVDHRLVDGAELTAFQTDLLAGLRDPILLLG